MGPVICIPVLRRYDLLHEQLLSLRPVADQIEEVRIVDNGRRWSDVQKAMAKTLPGEKLRVHIPPEPAGVAESWNYFLYSTPDGRIIANDDILFSPRSIAAMVNTPGDIVFGFGFSCFLIRDSCVRLVGTFDESISPGYAYYEDCDYMERIRQTSTSPFEHQRVVAVNAPDTGIQHGREGNGSCTYRAGTQKEIDEHWRRHHIAHQNFLKKYHAEPDELERRWNARQAAVSA